MLFLLIANEALHISLFQKQQSSNIYISFLEPEDDYKFEFTYSVWLNPGVMSAADAQEVSYLVWSD